MASLALFESALAQGADTVTKRTGAIYKRDAAMSLRKSQDNPRIKQIYDEFLGSPNSHEAHRLCHTEYVDRSAKIEALKERGIVLAL